MARFPRLGPRQMETLMGALTLAAEVRDDEAQRLDGYGFPDEAREQRHAAEATRALIAKLGEQ